MHVKPIALAALLLAAPAAAQYRDYEAAGVWRAFGGGPVCGMESSSGARSIRITWDTSTPVVTFRLSRDGWRIPPGISLPVVMQVDRQEPIIVRNARGGGEGLSFNTDRDRFSDFSPQFSSGTTLRISFPEGDEPTWFVSLRGSSSTYSAFWRCVQAAREEGTQPFRERPRGWERDRDRPWERERPWERDRDSPWDRTPPPFRGQVPL